MRTIIILVLVFITLWVLYSFNVQYQWVELQFGWTEVAVGIAAAGGPLQYFRQKRNEKVENKQQTEYELKFRTLKHNEFLRRQQNNSNPINQGEITENRITPKDDFSTTDSASG